MAALVPGEVRAEVKVGEAGWASVAGKAREQVEVVVWANRGYYF